MYVREKACYDISFIVRSKDDSQLVLKSGIEQENIFSLDDGIRSLQNKEKIDYDKLNSIMDDEIPSIHNMILGDHIVSKLPYEEAIAYTEHLVNKFESFYDYVNPSVVIGCHDGIHSSIGCAVAKANNIPWFALSFCALPIGYVAFRDRIVPDKMVCIHQQKRQELLNFAEKTLQEFEMRTLEIPAYVSSHNVRLALMRLPNQLKKGLSIFKQTYFGGLNRYLDYDFKYLFKQFFRKKKNMLLLPKKWFLTEPPSEPFVFFGLHMQPETTIDVYAPFYSNQFHMIELITRAMPVTHKLLVKLHKSDADNYSRHQLKKLKKLPRLELVDPNSSSRSFIENCSLLITITGNMGLEGALLGKSVIIFGKKNIEYFPNVTRVKDMTDFPALIRSKLDSEKPSRDLLVESYANYLKPYFKATSNYWKRGNISTKEKDRFKEFLQSLETYLTNY
jgi:hypothetical protein